MQSAHHEQSAKSPAAGVQGLLKGPGSSGVLDLCSLVQSEPYFGSILSNKFIYLFLLFTFYPTQLEREKLKLKRESGRFGKIRLKAGDLPPKAGELESLVLMTPMVPQ